MLSLPRTLPLALLALTVLSGTAHAQEQPPEYITTSVQDNGYGFAPSTTPAPAPKGMHGHYGDATTDNARSPDTYPDASGYVGASTRPNAGANLPDDGATAATFRGLGTTSGWAVGLQGSGYQYEEPGIGVKIKGPTVGGEVDGTARVLGPVWGRIEANGWVAPSQQYSGSTFGGSPLTGKKTDYKGDGRLLVGTDLEFTGGPFGAPFVIAPYGGYGIRDLYDTAGTYDENAAGYRRNNFLQYLAIGADSRLRILSLPFEWRNEFDYMITGKQTSYFSDAGGNDVTTTQDTGYGYRTHLALLTQLVDVGVYYQHWSVDASSVGDAGGSVGLIYEPQNHTDEVGLFLRHRF